MLEPPGRTATVQPARSGLLDIAVDDGLEPTPTPLDAGAAGGLVPGPLRGGPDSAGTAFRAKLEK